MIMEVHWTVGKSQFTQDDPKICVDFAYIGYCKIIIYEEHLT